MTSINNVFFNVNLVGSIFEFLNFKDYSASQGVHKFFKGIPFKAAMTTGRIVPPFKVIKMDAAPIDVHFQLRTLFDKVTDEEALEHQEKELAKKIQGDWLKSTEALLLRIAQLSRRLTIDSGVNSAFIFSHLFVKSQKTFPHLQTLSLEYIETDELTAKRFQSIVTTISSTCPQLISLNLSIYRDDRLDVKHLRFGLFTPEQIEVGVLNRTKLHLTIKSLTKEWADTLVHVRELSLKITSKLGFEYLPLLKGRLSRLFISTDAGLDAFLERAKTCAQSKSGSRIQGLALTELHVNSKLLAGSKQIQKFLEDYEVRLFESDSDDFEKALTPDAIKNFAKPPVIPVRDLSSGWVRRRY